MTTAKHQGVFLEQEKDHRREEEPDKFYFHNKEGNYYHDRKSGFLGKQRHTVSGIVEHKFRRIKDRIILPVMKR